MPRPGLKLTDIECEAITRERHMAKKRKDWKVRKQASLSSFVSRR